MKFNTPNKEIKNGNSFNKDKNSLSKKAVGISTFKPSDVVGYFRNEGENGLSSGRLPINKVIFSDIIQKSYSRRDTAVCNYEFGLAKNQMVYAGVYENIISQLGGNFPLSRMPFYGIKTTKELAVTGLIYDRDLKYVEYDENMVSDLEKNVSGFLLNFPKLIHIDLKKSLNDIYGVRPNIFVNFGRTGREMQEAGSKKEDGRSKLIFYPAKIVFSTDDEGLNSAKRVISYYVNNVLEPYLVNFSNTLRECIKLSDIVYYAPGKISKKESDLLDSYTKKLLSDKREILDEFTKISGIEFIKGANGRFGIEGLSDLDLLSEIIRIAFDGIMNNLAHKQVENTKSADNSEKCPIHKLLFSKLRKFDAQAMYDFSLTNSINLNFMNKREFVKTGSNIKEFLFDFFTSYDSLIKPLNNDNSQDLRGQFEALCIRFQQIVV